MERPYESDENATWHIEDECDGFEGAPMGDANYDGVAKGIANYGDGVCPECISDEDRSDLLQTAASHAQM